MAPKSKLKQISNLNKSPMDHLYQAQKKRNKKTEKSIYFHNCGSE